jgi:hypothetical protein
MLRELGFTGVGDNQQYDYMTRQDSNPDMADSKDLAHSMTPLILKAEKT